MMILNPVTCETIEVKAPAPYPRLQERADAKAARIAEKAARRAVASTASQMAELDAEAL